ncbi:uncharacterized protein LOC124897946 [Capsicum annuum]|uniref:uncharacterized protein LOC124897946 n=1 Tax=Capsicum annuum TaxID=4072 RepID=UPI001FB0E347|nr:uncharacterized protein LOC124897946 [Capsicum annuum]
MAKEYTISEFNNLMKKVEQIDVRVKEYLQKAGYDKWTRVYATVNRGFTLTSNIVEIINRHIMEARELPIYDFLEEVRKIFGRWNHNNRQVGTFTRTPICGRYNDLLELNEAKSTRMRLMITANLYKPVVVLGIYEIPLLPLPDRSIWEIPNFILSKIALPPKYKRPPRRPKKREREKSVGDFYKSKSTNSCSACGMTGHNRRSCRKIRRVE